MQRGDGQDDRQSVTQLLLRMTEGQLLQQGIPHAHGDTADKWGEVAFAGDAQIPLDVGGPPLLIAYGLGDAATAGRIMDHTACVRMMTPSVPVAIELNSGSADGEDHKLGAKMGTVKGGRAAATTTRIPIVKVSCGRAHTIMKQGGDEGGVRVCGENNHGQLGLGHKQPFALVTQVVPFFKQLKQGAVSSVAAGEDFCMVLLQDGRVFSWGQNRAGQLGLGILAATLKSLMPGDKFVEIAHVAAGGALACTAAVKATHRVTWFESTIAGAKRLHVGEGEWSDESAVGPMGVWGRIERDLAAFYTLEQEQMERMRRRQANIHRLLHSRYEATVAKDKALQRRIADLNADCYRKCKEASKLCQQDVQHMEVQWQKEAKDFVDKMLENEARAHGRAYIMENTALCRAATMWNKHDLPDMTHLPPNRRVTDASKDIVSAAADWSAPSSGAAQDTQLAAHDAGKGDGQAADSGIDCNNADLDFDCELTVSVRSASHLPKKDLLGKCDALTVVHLMGLEYMTEVIKRHYDPEWNTDFVFKLIGNNRPKQYASRDHRSCTLVFKVGALWPHPLFRVPLASACALSFSDKACVCP